VNKDIKTKETVLITGAGPTGITGRYIKEFLGKEYFVLAPSSKELDLTNDNNVRFYFERNHIDYVVHCATYRSNISQTSHMVDEELESNLRMYFSLASQCDKFEKMVYLGSGAEYDKTRAIANIKEDQFGERIPKEKYGFGKYIMNQHCRNSKNIYNLRMFGTLNPYERYTKNVVCNLCAKAVKGVPLTLRQDCLFSWVDIEDVTKAIKYIFEHDMPQHDYNIANTQSCYLSEIANMITQLSCTNNHVVFEKEGLNLEYTCNTEAFQIQFPIEMISIKDSVRRIYNNIYTIKDSIKIESIDNRWK